MVKQAFTTNTIPSVQVLQAKFGGALSIPGIDWLLKANFSPQGSDLLLTAPDGDQIHLQGFTSNPGSFSYIGTNNFSVTANVQARMAVNETLEIDCDGDSAADMEITMTGINIGDLSAADFLVT